MLDLIFFSTNAVKVSHFRYLGGKVGVSIKSFREINYYASYDEPRIDDRAELLKQSYKSALSQWIKRRRKSDDGVTTFFFEDTSVKIEALSKYVETPGVNVKFWMKDMNFQKLDELLKRSGDNRKATVRSDIVLHLPKKWQDLLGVKEDFVWFFGETNGEVCKNEEDVKPNLLYTWLDDKSFNRWFIPEGESRPLSSLDILTADKHDFRRKAFSGLVDILNKLKLIQAKSLVQSYQLDLPRFPITPAVILICGPSCSGKTTTATWINDEFGIPHIEASDFMYKAFWERHGFRSKYKISDFAEAALKSQPEIVASPIVKHIMERNFEMVIVTGFRSITEVEIFKYELPENMKLQLIYLDANFQLRLARAISRDRDDVTQEKFSKREEQEARMGLLEILRANNVSHIFNESTKENLYSRIRKQFKKALLSGTALNYKGKPESRLEVLILLTLLDSLCTSEWFTTTEISSRLNVLFSEEKSKNNVSRYFNQEYHPYFEARLRVFNGRVTTNVEYRLSPTGIGEAKILKKSYVSIVSRKKFNLDEEYTQLSLFDDTFISRT